MLKKMAPPRITLWNPPRDTYRLLVCAFAVFGVTLLLLGVSATFAESRAVGGLTPKVLIVGIDGCRPDALQAAATPNIDALIMDGAVSYEAQTGDRTMSGPGWSSMLTSVWRDKHGVVDNSFQGANFDDYPHFFTRIAEIDPTIFKASIVHWSPINTEILSDADFVLTGLSDSNVTSETANLIASQDPDIVFMHLDDIDGAGHGCCYDPADADYLAAIEVVDTQVGVVMAAIVSRPTYPTEDWLVILSTDHGGSGTGHGQNIPSHRTIFVVVSGPSACGGTIVPPPGIVDVAATALNHFGPIQPEWDWDGVPVGLTNCIDGACAADLVASTDQVAGTVTLTWQAAVDLDAMGYELRRNGQLIATFDLSTLNYVDLPVATVDGHAVYDYELRSFGGSEGEVCPPLTAGAILSTGDVRFADDFEDHADDAALEASGWSIVDENNPLENASFTLTNPGGRGNPPRFDGKATGGRFLISDSDWGGATPNPTGSGMSHDIWSPAFDCSGLAAVWLHLDCAALLNNNGKAVFDIDVSSDLGGTWANVFRGVAPARTEAAPFVSVTNADGYFGRLDVDLSGTAAGQPAVRFRVRHFEPNWDWWIALDNVIVDDIELNAGGDVVLLPVEDFSGGIPAAWTVRGETIGDNSWTTNDPCTRSIVAAGASFPYLDGRAVHRLGTDFVILDSGCDPDPAEDELLITPPVDCTTMGAVYLHYRSEIVTDGGAIEEVLLSLDGGATFEPTPLMAYSGGGLTLSEEPAYAERLLYAPRAAGEPAVAFGFRYASSGDAGWWAVDDVRVTGCPGTSCAPTAGIETPPSGTPPSVGLVALPPRPNPFVGSTDIPFKLSRGAHVRVSIYSTAGRKVRTLADGLFPAGLHFAEWDGRTDEGWPVSSGVYFARLVSRDQVTRRALLLVR